MVRTNAGGFADTDLRVGGARDGRPREAHDRLAEALQLGSSWDRILRRAARLEMNLREPDQAACFLAQFTRLNKRWGEVEVEDEIYEPLRKNSSWPSPRCYK